MKAYARRALRIFLVLLAVNMLYAFAGFVVVPAYVKKATIRGITKAPDYEASIEKVSFNPYTFVLSFRHVLIDGTPRGILFTGSTVSLDFDPIASLRSGMLVFGDFLLFDGRVTYIKRTIRSPFLEFLIAFDWSRVPQFSIARARVLNSGIVYTNVALPKFFFLRINTLNIDIGNFLMHGRGENSLSLNAVTGDDERLSAHGNFFLEPYATSGEAVFENLKMHNYEPYIRVLDGYMIADGRLSGRTRYDLDSSPTDPKSLLSDLSFTVKTFDLLKEGEAAPLFGFSAFQLDDADLDFKGKDYVFDSALITGGSVALDRLLQGEKTASSPFRGGAQWGSFSLEKSSFRADPFRASIGKSALLNGNISLSDVSFAPPAAIDISGLDISLGTFLAEDPKPAEFSVGAKIGDGAPFQVHGETNPFNFAGHTQFRMLAQNVSVLPFSPYAVKHLGNGLRAGAIALDTSFLLHDRKLNMRNKLTLKQVKAVKEKRSESPTGDKQPSYPIPLALALLTDENGELELYLPVTGSLDDPHWDFKKTIIKAILSPFTNLVDWLKGDMAERLYQAFPLDSSMITEQNSGKLDAVIAYMQESPDTVIDIQGSVKEGKESGNLLFLADDRAAAVKNYLVEKGSIAEERIFILDAATGELRTKGSRAYLYLNAPATLGSPPTGP